MTTTPAPLTYGDTFTIPSAPGVVWEIRDRRSVEEPNPATPAEAVPIAQNGEPVEYNTPVKIGRAARVGLVVKITRRHAENGEIRPYLTARSWEQRPTDAQEKAVEADLAALSFDVPPLTADEIVSRAIARAEDAYIGGAVREAVNGLNLPKSYSSTDAEYRAVIDALHADPATIPAIRAALVASFAAELDKWKP